MAFAQQFIYLVLRHLVSLGWPWLTNASGNNANRTGAGRLVARMNQNNRPSNQNKNTRTDRILAESPHPSLVHPGIPFACMAHRLSPAVIGSRAWRGGRR